jgi:hypothetical protein
MPRAFVALLLLFAACCAALWECARLTELGREFEPAWRDTDRAVPQPGPSAVEVRSRERARIAAEVRAGRLSLGEAAEEIRRSDGHRTRGGSDEENRRRVVINWVAISEKNPDHPHSVTSRLRAELGAWLANRPAPEAPR